MKQLILLVKTGLMEQLKWRELRNTKDTKKKWSTIGILIAFLLVGGMLIFYSGISAYGLIYVGMGELLPAAAVTAVGTMTLFFTILKTNGILFGYKDYEMLTALPIKTSTLVTARFLQLYGTNFLMGMVIMLPMGIVYGVMLHKGVSFYMIWLIGMVAAPLIPTTIAAMIGVIIMAISSRMRHSNVISGILSMGLLIAILVGSTALGGMGNTAALNSLTLILEEAKSSIEKFYPVSTLFRKAVLEESFLFFLLFIGVSLLWYGLFLIIVSSKYKKINSMLTAHSLKARKQKDLNTTAGSAKRALVKKEWKRFLNSNVYMTNMGVGVIMMLLFAGALAFLPQETMAKILSSGDISLDLSSIGVGILPFILGGLGGLCCTTCCSLSLEGGNIEILKALPLSAGDIYKGKITMNLMLTIPATLVSALLISFKFANSIMDVLFLFGIPIAYDILMAVWGMYLNIRMPNFTWENEIVVVKQAAPVLFAIFGGLLFAFLGGIAANLVPKSSTVPVMFFIALVILVIAFLLYQKIKRCPLPEK